MHTPKNPSYLKPYEEAVAAHGAGFKATLWGSEQAQILRFDVMIDLATFDDAVIVDAGCGQGDFAGRLIDCEVPFARFIGIDAMAPMIEAARERALPRCEFVAGDFLTDPSTMRAHEPDFICMSGSLNTLSQEQAMECVRVSFDVAAQGVIFNFLSDRPHERWAGRDLTPASRFDTAALLDWCLTLTSRVSFTQAYLDGHDATILMLHDGGEA